MQKNETNNIAVKEHFVLYNGCEMKIDTGVTDTDMMELNEANKQKYNTTYYNYEQGEFLGETQGILQTTIFEDYASVSNVKRIAISEKYDAIPRKYQEIKELPKELTDMAKYSSVNINSIDLDGDGTEEKLVCYTINRGTVEASSKIILMDSNYKKIADLVDLENGFWANIKNENNKIFLSLNDVEYIDIDNDGIMEIIIRVPTYASEGTARLSILKYNKGNLEGETDIKASVQS